MELAIRSGSNKVSAYCANVRQLTSRLRVLTAVPREVNANVIEAATVPIAQNALLGNKQFPFPGNVVPQATYNHTHTVAEPQLEVLPMNEVVNKPVANFKVASGEMAVELKAVECPETMKTKVHELFPEQNSENISVLNVNQKTENDMSEWSTSMEIEWMAAASGFVESAMAACKALNNFGYWADFIDPSSGKPYMSQSNNDATLNVTDDEYRSLGYDIKDMGCCKILAHALWGKKVFVGTMFTNAPVNSPAVAEILAKVNVA